MEAPEKYVRQVYTVIRSFSMIRSEMSLNTLKQDICKLSRLMQPSTEHSLQPSNSRQPRVQYHQVWPETKILKCLHLVSNIPVQDDWMRKGQHLALAHCLSRPRTYTKQCPSGEYFLHHFKIMRTLYLSHFKIIQLEIEEESSVDHLFVLWLLYYCVENNQDPEYMKEKSEGT